MSQDRPASGRPDRSPDLGIPGVEGLTAVGSGGFAVVYRARQPAFNRTVAIKVLSRIQLDPAAIRRFERERTALGTLSGHPNIVTVYESGLTADGVPYLVMEYLPLGSYAERLVEDGPVPWAEVLAIGVRLSGALETAHRAGVLHRDVKPENVLRSSFGDAKLADFGIARVVEGPETQSGRLELSVLHSPPEIIDGRPPSPSSDVYSLGSTLFALIHGRAAFYDPEDDSLVRLLNRIAVEDPPDLKSAGAPAEVCDVLERALAKSAAQRFDSAAAFGRSLQETQGKLGLEVTALPLEGVSPLPAPPARSREPAPVAPHDEPSIDVRRPRFSSRSVTGLVAALALVAGATTWLVEGGRAHPAVRSSAPTTVAQAPSTRATPPAPATAFPASGELAAGRYRTTMFMTGLAITLGDGWKRPDDSPEDAASLELTRGSVFTDPSFGLYQPTKVFDPRAAPSTSKFSYALESLPADLVAWLEAHPRLHVLRTSPARRGNTTGTEVDFSVASGYKEKDCPTDCVLLFQPSTGGVAVFSGAVNRFYVFSLGGHQYIAAASASAGEFDRFAADIERILASLTVPGSA